MSTHYELTSVGVRTAESVRARKTESRRTPPALAGVSPSEAGPAVQARASFITQCTRQSLQVWWQRTHFDSDQGVRSDRVHSSRQQKEEYAQSVDTRRHVALAGTVLGR